MSRIIDSRRGNVAHFVAIREKFLFCGNGKGKKTPIEVANTGFASCF